MHIVAPVVGGRHRLHWCCVICLQQFLNVLCCCCQLAGDGSFFRLRSGTDQSHIPSLLRTRCGHSNGTFASLNRLNWTLAVQCTSYAFIQKSSSLDRVDAACLVPYTTRKLNMLSSWHLLIFGSCVDRSTSIVWYIIITVPINGRRINYAANAIGVRANFF